MFIILSLLLGVWLLGLVHAGTLLSVSFHHFFIAIARSVLNNHGESGTSLHPVIWSNTANPKRRRIHPGGGKFC